MHHNLVTVFFYLFLFLKFVKLQSFWITCPCSFCQEQEAGLGWLSSGGWAVLVTLANAPTLISCEAQPKSMFEHPLISTVATKSPEMSFLVSWFKFRFVRASAESCNAWNASLVRPVPKTVATRRSEALGDSQHGKGHVFWMELYLTWLIAALRLQDCNYIDRFRWH